MTWSYTASRYDHIFHDSSLDYPQSSPTFGLGCVFDHLKGFVDLFVIVLSEKFWCFSFAIMGRGGGRFIKMATCNAIPRIKYSIIQRNTPYHSKYVSHLLLSRITFEPKIDKVTHFTLPFELKSKLSSYFMPLISLFWRTVGRWWRGKRAFLCW